MPDNIPPVTEIDYTPSPEDAVPEAGPVAAAADPAPIEETPVPAQILKLTPVPSRAKAKPLSAPDPPILFVFLQRLFHNDRAA